MTRLEAIRARLEAWRDVVGAEGWYEVSTMGRVRRVAPGPRTHPGTVLRPHTNIHGYLSVMLCLGSERPRRRVLIHKLVLEAFVGPRPLGMECRHLNGDQKDNRLENLCWGSKKENRADQFRHGTSADGERNGQAKLTANDVRDMHARSLRGESQSSLAAAYGVGQAHVSRILRGVKWAKVAAEQKGGL